ncbi:MAG: hypothetical protein IPN85_12875 [Flavobacteriales bacterium]|nr:hypothetical protein [Flavobacteriales bacterium]
MGRFLRQGLVFLAVAMALYAVAMLVLARVDLHGHPLIYRTGSYYHLKGGIAYEKFKEYDRTAHYDVIVLGSSHAYRGYDPRVFAAHGLRMFNLGSSAQTPLNTYWLLKEYVTAANCGQLVIDLYEGAMINEGLESTSELVMNMTSERAAIGMVMDLHDLRGLNLLALRWSRTGVGPDFMDSTYRTGGFAERTDSLKTPISPKRHSAIRCRPEQLSSLGKCLELCQNRGIPVVLVTHYYPGTSDRVAHEAFRATIDSVRAPFKVPYLDLAYAHQLDDQDHFYDHNHLNLAGVRLFNEALIPLLRKEAGPHQPSTD